MPCLDSPHLWDKCERTMPCQSTLLAWALLPHPCFAEAGAASLSPGRSLARNTPPPPACPKSLLCLSQSDWSFFLYIFVWWELTWWWSFAQHADWNVNCSAKCSTTRARTTTLDKKKDSSPRLQWEERCSILWYHARSRTISAEQKSHIVRDDLALRWLLAIKHDITRLNCVFSPWISGTFLFFFFFCPG